MILIKYIGTEIEEKHKHDYRWIKDKSERDKWIKKNWIISINDSRLNIFEKLLFSIKKLKWKNRTLR